MELSLFTKLQRTPKMAIPVAFALFLLLTITPAIYPLFAYPNFLLKTSSRPPQSEQTPSEDHSPSFNRSSPSDHQTPSYDHSPVDEQTSTMGIHVNDDGKECDLFTGEWVPDPDAPYYTNMTCWAIHEHQNCMKYGRPDTEFMKWRWKPDRCEMPVFDPNEFLEIVRGKAMGFVGDSISRNQVQSLLCLLSRVEYPMDISSTSDTDFRKWKYQSYNFTVHALWAPFLVRHTEADTLSPDNSGLFNLYLDEFNPEWMTQIDQLDYLVISSGHWFFRPVVFYENQQIVGCHYCGLPNVNPLPLYYGYRKALRTSLRTIVKDFKGLAFLRSFSPPHFEGGPWNKGGDCVRTRPYRRNETVLKRADLELHNIQLEEFTAAEEEGRKKGLRLRLIDTTPAMLLRPDGHPGRYGHLPKANATLFKDCVHWCLPGPIDTWNDFLLQMLKMEETRQYNEKGKQLHPSNREKLL